MQLDKPNVKLKYLLCFVFSQNDLVNKHTDVVLSKNDDTPTAGGNIKLNSKENGNIFLKRFKI